MHSRHLHPHGRGGGRGDRRSILLRVHPARTLATPSRCPHKLNCTSWVIWWQILPIAQW